MTALESVTAHLLLRLDHHAQGQKALEGGDKTQKDALQAKAAKRHCQCSLEPHAYRPQALVRVAQAVARGKWP